RASGGCVCTTTRVESGRRWRCRFPALRRCSRSLLQSKLAQRRQGAKTRKAQTKDTTGFVVQRFFIVTLCLQVNIFLQRPPNAKNGRLIGAQASSLALISSTR